MNTTSLHCTYSSLQAHGKDHRNLCFSALFAKLTLETEVKDNKII